MAASDEVPGSSNETTAAMKDNQQKQATTGKMTMYPHLQLLSRLQAISSTRNDTDDDNKSEDPSTDDQQQEQSNNEWDLSTDALLATLLHEFSSHMQSRTHHVSSEIQALQKSVNQVGVEVGLVQQQWMKKSHDICMEQVVGEDDESDDDSEEGDDDVGTNKLSTQPQQEEVDDDDDDDDSSADIARLEAEEKAAIQKGMKALSLFFDPKRKSKKKETDDVVDDNNDDISEDDNNIVISTEEDNMIGDNCYYYPAAEADGFNQRPLPFIIGSREFMESCSVGGGGLIEET